MTKAPVVLKLEHSAPTGLIQFTDCSLLLLPYYNGGTLIDLIYVLKDLKDDKIRECIVAFVALQVSSLFRRNENFLIINTCYCHMLQMIEYLEAIHGVGIAHFDIKTGKYRLLHGYYSCHIS